MGFYCTLVPLDKYSIPGGSVKDFKINIKDWLKILTFALLI